MISDTFALSSLDYIESCPLHQKQFYIFFFLQQLPLKLGQVAGQHSNGENYKLDIGFYKKRLFDAPY